MKDQQDIPVASSHRQRPSRSGGRAGRITARAIDRQQKTGYAGVTGGTYQPLSEQDIHRIHATALDVLEKIGIGDPTPEILEYALPKGCLLSDDGRLRFPRALVEDVLARVPKKFDCYAPDPKHDHQLEGSRIYTGTSGESVSILDYETQQYRPSTLTDIYDVARLTDQLEHIHAFYQPFIATEYSQALYVHDINVAYAALSGTSKSISISTIHAEHVDALVGLFDLYVGCEGGFIKRPFCTIGGCPIISPLRFGKENTEVMVRCAELGIKYGNACAPQSGATSPAALAGTLVQCFAESLACLVVMHLIRSDAKLIFGMWPFISDLRTGGFSGGSGEAALVAAAAVQMGNYYDLVQSIPSGMTDSKTMDAQAGYEKALTTTAVALAGGNHLCAYPGTVGSLMGLSFEGMLIDNDMLGNILRLVRGIEVNDETLSFDVIQDTVFGTGHYLNHQQTLQLMQSEYLYPRLADRRASGEWEDSGSPDIYQAAREKVKQLLASHYPRYIKPDVDARIREKFPIKLDPLDKKPGNGRW